MKRREFITLLGGAAVGAWPPAAQAQQPERIRRIGLLLNLAADDPTTHARVAAFLQELQQLGWSEGRNLRIDYRWSEGDVDRIRKNAAELVALAPDVIIAHGGTIMGPLQRVTHTTPIVFVSVSDPVAGGFAASLARPGGNATGFSTFEYGTSAKWLETLKQVAPQVTRVAIMRDPEQVSGAGQLGAIQSLAPTYRVELISIDVHDTDEIKRGIATFASQPNGGLIVTTTALAQIHRELIITLATQYRLPAVYPYRFFVAGGGLISYGPDALDLYRRAAGYVDRILKGEKPADLPVQAPTKYLLVINLKAAKAIGLDVPPSLLARADEVIE